MDALYVKDGYNEKGSQLSVEKRIKGTFFYCGRHLHIKSVQAKYL